MFPCILWTLMQYKYRMQILVKHNLTVNEQKTISTARTN